MATRSADLYPDSALTNKDLLPVEEVGDARTNRMRVICTIVRVIAAYP